MPNSQAQLFSPGKLSLAHVYLEGISDCVSCHTLGSPGIDNTRCLGCHEPLKARIDDNSGFHANIGDDNCASCHEEHIGADFEIVRFDTLVFDYKETGYELTGSHVQNACSDCHN